MLLSNLIENEITSTAYMLRTLYKSIIRVNNDPNHFIRFKIADINTLTGEWAKDADKITLDTSTLTNRLIMGFGPSASGKTHWAKTIITLFSSVDKNFPTIFLTIDGGICRETSIVYQYIVAATHNKCFAGFDNLVTADIIEKTLVGKSLFSSSIVKEAIDTYLQKYPNRISLYVPETLGGCGRPMTKPCKTTYEPYITITGDKKWIGLLIWQHETKENCSQVGIYKCKGTTESGTSRQETGGKKYSSLAWKQSFTKGMKHALGISKNIIGKQYVVEDTEGDDNIGAPGERIRIHNCGSNDGISIMEDFTPERNGSSTIRNALMEEKNQDEYHYQYKRITDGFGIL